MKVLTFFLMIFCFSFAASADSSSHQYLTISRAAPLRIANQPEVQPKWVEPMFGPEFTFSEENIKKVAAQLRLIDRVKEHLIENQPVGAKFYTVDGVTYTSPNGWAFTVGVDPEVVEVQMRPMTAAKFTQFKGDIQDAIFASASNVGLFPYLFQGGGHINISWSTFSQNLLLLRNFLVDFYNHNELTMGIFNYDTGNALPIQMHGKELLDRFRATISMIDRGELNSPEAVRKMLVDDRPRQDLYSSMRQTLPKDVALYAGNLNLRDNAERLVTSQLRFEIRAVRPQASADVFARQVTLLRDRIHYLYKLNKPIAMQIQTPMQPMNLEQHRFNPPVEAQDAMRSFYKYVTESGQKWADHRDYMWPNWISSGELEKFEASEWFKHAEAGKCARELAPLSND